MSELTAHEVLVRARNLIEREGWCQGRFRNGSQRCALGGLIDGAGGVVTPTVGKAEVALGAVVPDCRVAVFNDAPGRTKGEVLAAFDKAISATAPDPVDPLEGVDVDEAVAA